MAECSQEFKDMLAGYRDSVYLDGNKDSYVYSDATECAGDSILQYVAELEAIRDKVREVVGPLAADMVGGYAMNAVINIPPVTLTEHADLYGPPGSKRVVAMCGTCLGAVDVRGGVAWSTPDSRASELKAAEHEAVRLAVLRWLSDLED